MSKPREEWCGEIASYGGTHRKPDGVHATGFYVRLSRPGQPTDGRLVLVNLTPSEGRLVGAALIEGAEHAERMNNREN